MKKIGIGVTVGVALCLAGVFLYARNFVNSYYSQERRLLIEVPFESDSNGEFSARIRCVLPRGIYRISVFIADYEGETAEISGIESGTVVMLGTQKIDMTTSDGSPEYFYSKSDLAGTTQGRSSLALPFPWTNQFEQGAMITLRKALEVSMDGQKCEIGMRFPGESELLNLHRCSLRIESFLDAM